MKRNCKTLLGLMLTSVLLFAYCAEVSASAAQVPIDHIVDVIVEEGYTAGLRSDGRVIFTGEDLYERGWKQAEQWTGIEKLEIIGRWVFGYKKDGSIVTTSNFDVSGWNDVVSIVYSYEHSLLAGLRSDGTVSVAFDINAEINREYLEVTNWRNIKQLIYGYISYDGYDGFELIGLRSDGSVVGTNGERWLGSEWKLSVTNNPITRLVHIYGYVLGLRSNGTVTGIPDEDRDQFYNITSLIAYFDGYTHLFGIRNDGSVAVRDFLLEEDDTAMQEIISWNNIKKLSYCIGGVPVGLRNDGTVAVVKTRWGMPIDRWNVSSWTDVADIFVDADCLVGLRTDGMLLATGGQFGTREYLDEIAEWKDIVSVSIAEDHIVGIKADGTLVAAGDNHHGQCNIK